jgi:5-deoxy-5-amino-3-dehydroquinate synthase
MIARGQFSPRGARGTNDDEDIAMRGSPQTVETVTVDLAERSYPIHIGSGVRHMLAELVAASGASKAAVVTARPAEWTPDPGIASMTVSLTDGERTKTLAQVEDLCRRFAQFRLSRRDIVVAVGGGSTTDTAGLAAALYHRGVSIIHVPTSLLAQADASVGGKTAVNLPEGKNLVGAYWQPKAVLCDTDYYATLPAQEMINGYGEIARCHFIGTGDLCGLPVQRQVAASIALKAAIVSSDERDGGLRHVLNYGHTLGHAIEVVTGFEVGHGIAVGIGTVFAGRLAGELGRIAQTRVDEHLEVVRHYGLPTSLPDGIEHDRLIDVMWQDKKATRGMTFVLDGPHGVEIVPGVPEVIVRKTLTAC